MLLVRRCFEIHGRFSAETRLYFDVSLTRSEFMGDLRAEQADPRQPREFLLASGESSVSSLSAEESKDLHPSILHPVEV